MTFIAPDTAPHRIIRGADTIITHRVYLEADETAPAVTASSCEVQVMDDTGTDVGSALTPSWDASTATLSVTVPGSSTTGETLGRGAWAALWTVVATEGSQVHQRRARLVRRVVAPTLLTSELTSRYPELENIRTSAELRTGIAEAHEDLARDLEARGILLDQITDPSWRHRAHHLRAAAGEYHKAATDTQDDAFGRRAESLMAQYLEALDAGIPYDEDQDGDEDTAQEQAADDGYFWRRGRLS